VGCSSRILDVTTLPAVQDAGADLSVDGFVVGYVAEDGTPRRVPLMDATAVRFEVMAPARRFNSRKGQRHLPGRWWSATDGRHVGYESWLERDHLVAMDFDPTVVGIASQPFWLSWTAGDGRVRSHAPDYFARRVDGSAVVVDCRPVERRAPRDVAAFDATRGACGLLGWEYRLVGALDPIVTANLRWLAGYRHPRHGIPWLAAALRATFAEEMPLLAGAEAVGDPIGVLPVLFHLLWRHDLVADLSVPLHPTTAVTAAITGVVAA
jgi:hypothetical protein